MPLMGLGILWPTEENYARFVAVSDDSVHETFAAFQASVVPKLQRLAAEGKRFEKVDFDPDEMAEWCRANFGKVESGSRAAYAGYLLAMRDKSADR